MKINDIYEVKIDNVDNNGNGVCRIDNVVTFVSNGLKDEILKIQIDTIEKNYTHAHIIKIIKPSELRENIPCKYYELCGGCSFLHTTYSNEIEIKKAYIERLFNREVNVLENKNIYNYRNKVTLHCINGKLGYYNSKTHDLCEIDECLLLNEKINLKIADLKNFNLNGISEIMIRCINNQIMINIIGEKIDSKLNDIECDSLYINSKYIKGKEYLIDEINNIKYSIYPESFYQVNKEGMINIYNKALDYAQNADRLIDLYCGIGTIGIWLNSKFNKVYGIEINASSIRNANINKELNNLDNITFKLGDAKLIQNNIKESDLIVVDPPRAGLSKNVISILNNSKVKKIIYISCNPKTLKRDIELMNNYELKDLSICNMFNRTSHVETVCVLERK